MLRENYKNDILDTSENVNRKYNMVTNPDDTVSLEDVTVYSQEGDTFGASDINATNHVVNILDSAVDNIDLRVDSVSGKPQWKERGADTWQNFNSGGIGTPIEATVSGTGSTSTFTVSSSEPIKGFFIVSVLEQGGITYRHTLYYDREFGEDVYYDYEKSNSHKVISSTPTSFVVQNITQGLWWNADKAYGFK